MNRASQVTVFSDTTRALAQRIEESDSITWAELRRDFPTASSRLSDLVKKGYVERTGRGRYSAVQSLLR
jgi:predicted transcriptional regulator of viral defense system